MSRYSHRDFWSKMKMNMCAILVVMAALVLYHGRSSGFRPLMAEATLSHGEVINT